MYTSDAVNSDFQEFCIDETVLTML